VHRVQGPPWQTHDSVPADAALSIGIIVAVVSSLVPFSCVTVVRLQQPAMVVCMPLLQVGWCSLRCLVGAPD
jgi:hypothetical protein